MSCSPEITERKQVNAEQVAYRMVCCGEHCCLKDGQVACKREHEHECCTPSFHSCEDSWHAIAIEAEDHDSRLEAQKQRTAARHSKMKAWREQK